MRSDRYTQDTSGNKKNPLRILLPLILVLALAVAGSLLYLYKSTEKSITLEFKRDHPVIPFGEKHSSMFYVKSASGEVSPASAAIDTGKVGEMELVYTVTKPMLGGLLKPSKDFTLSYTVEDREPPMLIWSGAGTVIETGSEFDINKVIAYGDNADPEPSVSVKGSVDTSAAGDYPLRVTVTDASGNPTSWDLKVEVADEIPETEPEESDKIKFKDFVSANKGDGRSFGIDVSSWQEDVDYEKVKKAGCEFVMIRAGYSEGDGKTFEFDDRFKENMDKAKAAGLKVGVYMYSYDNTEDKAKASARWLIEALDKTELDLPVAFDWEDFGQFQTYKMSFADLNRLYDAFADEISKAGYEPMLYGSKLYLEEIWENTGKRPVWLAHYADRTNYKGPYRIWQAANTGRIKGINGDVDLDIMYEN